MTNRIQALFDLHDKTAVVTGGGGDLCSMMSQALCDAGARVAVLDLSLEKASRVADSIVASGGIARAFACDVLDEKSLATANDSILALWGVPDILINGAGGNVPSGSTKVEFLEREQLDEPGGA